MRFWVPGSNTERLRTVFDLKKGLYIWMAICNTAQSMANLVASFANIEWDDPAIGVREKKIVIGAKAIRMLELTGDIDHPDWCLTGHAGFVLEGEFILDIDGVQKALQKGDVFVVEKDVPGHRHIPIVHEGKKVRLLLVDGA